MPSCAVATCHNTHRTKESTVTKLVPSFHKFPNGDLGKIWRQLCKRRDVIQLDNAVVCSDHFREQDYQRNLKRELLGLPIPKLLKANAIPSLHIPGKPTASSSDREERQSRRDNKILVNKILSGNTLYL